MPLLKLKSQQGIGLIEVIVALGISIIIVTSIVSLSIYSLRSSTQSKFMLEGAKLADQEVELLRASRDTKKWSSFINELRVKNCASSAGCYVHPDTLSITAGSQSIPSIGGSRNFVVSDPSGDGSVNGSEQVLRFSVTVTWASGGTAGTSSTYTYTDLSSWVGD